MTDSSETIVALATAPGVGAIAVIRLSGPDALKIANRVFKGKDLELMPTHTIHFGTVRDGETILDEVLASLFIAPHSYTKEHVVELSTHGSPYIVEQIIHLLIRNGARAARPGEFTLRAFLNGGLDLSQAEAVADLISSDSRASHQVAMQQMRGRFSSQLQELRTQLIHFASLIELELDFSEEDVEFANRDALNSLIVRITTVLAELIHSFELGNVIKQGINTVIAGRPNAGKSTLLNTLLNEDRAIISEIAGTTRDTIEEVLNINGVNFRLIDTAGIREATDTIEAIGVEKTMQKISQTSVLIYLFDVLGLSASEIMEDVTRLYRPGIPFIAVANKIDLSVNNRFREIKLPADVKVIAVSAREKQHTDELKQLLYDAVTEGKLNTGQTMVTNIRHVEALRRAHHSLQSVSAGLHHPVTSDFLAMDIRQALYYLGEITGQVTTDDLLENIFSKFCIGK
ncbi:tRNA uridine-5-carboxymethylaminomethyl(34) synthesis GTPase MnmE [Hufsiella ginkgonis]|uniref:tRNA modification GTPase MnmE n=1 Tax=Hufsiella ginkgonis TaxID=2695274 RepID=A0A7K1Y072_9SPHI|nr:tRNA uridine-5-carboxymethylaminomethyl(34) synthesis GTPase MnmE [Hufsiella ginkgonis]MXV16620.1 tRNA uridine-5-carboxymethylaminomethyl(34) synthesis GTPase MnmE [Hufsiella ginkgonis]